MSVSLTAVQDFIFLFFLVAKVMFAAVTETAWDRICASATVVTWAHYARPLAPTMAIFCHRVAVIVISRG